MNLGKYETGAIYQGDLSDLVWALPPDSIDLVVTSPPYFDARTYGKDTTFRNEDDWLNFCIRTLVSLRHVIKPEGVIWWNTGSGYKNGRKMTEVYKLVIACEKIGLYLVDEFPWIKKSTPPKLIKNRPYSAWEHNYIFAKNPEEVIYYRDNVRVPYAKATLERMKYSLGSLSGDQAGDYKDTRKMVKPNPGGATPPNYLITAQDTSKRPHPAPMMYEVANWAIRAYTEPEEVVLDPMMGAGTTAIEAEKLGRKWIGFELHQQYVDMSNLSLERLHRGDDPYNGLKVEYEERYGQTAK